MVAAVFGLKKADLSRFLKLAFNLIFSKQFWMDIVIITGSAGLIGSEASKFFHEKGFKVIGIDNDMRSYFFGSTASTAWNRNNLEENLSNYENYEHSNIDIRDYAQIEENIQKIQFGYQTRCSYSCTTFSSLGC